MEKLSGMRWNECLFASDIYKRSVRVVVHVYQIEAEYFPQKSEVYVALVLWWTAQILFSIF
jgi:hypothetical protein